MKKVFALVLALLMAFALCGCADNLPQIEIPPFPEVTPTPAPTTLVPEKPAPEGEGGNEQQPEDPIVVTPEPVEKKPQILAAFQRTSLEQYDQNEGETLILTFSYDVLRLVSEDFAESTAKINEVLATVEDCFHTGNDNGMDLKFPGYDAMLEAAEDNYSYAQENEGAELSLEFSDSLTAHVSRLDEKVFSVIYQDSNFTGGAHGSYGAVAYNFDMSTGERLTLDQLSEDPEEFSAYLVGVMLEMAEADEDEYFSQRIEDSFLPEGGREEAFGNLLRDGSWYFDREGMVVSSTLYELGPYAAGTVDFHIPYEMLEGKMDSRWTFPTERSGKGRIKAAELSSLNGGDLEIIDKLTANEDGVELCLVAEGQVYDVVISSVYYVDRFYEKCQLWCASSLTDCAVQLQAVVPEGLPDLQIVYYTADGERHGKLLSQSGTDGSYMLVDDNIQAVG